MKEIKIETKKKYSVFISKGSSNIPFLLDEYKINDVYIITDENINQIYNRYFEQFKIKIRGKRIIKPGESSKNYSTIEEIYTDLINTMCTKKTAIVAIGGGIVGDISGFVASTFMRGLRFINIPTTLLSQCDSSIGGKTGYNYLNYKNIIGTIYQPEIVFIDVNFIKSLSNEDYYSGIAEIIKYGCICDKYLFEYIEANKKAIKNREEDKIQHIIFESAKIKGSIIEKDEYDDETRHILNFGHTIAHSIESVSNFTINHGNAVALGMIIEAYISFKLGYLKKSDFEKLKNIINYFEFPIYNDLDINSMILFMKNDKKNTSNEIKFVIIESLGNLKGFVDVNQQIIYDSLKDYMEGSI